MADARPDTTFEIRILGVNPVARASQTWTTEIANWRVRDSEPFDGGPENGLRTVSKYQRKGAGRASIGIVLAQISRPKDRRKPSADLTLRERTAETWE